MISKMVGIRIAEGQKVRLETPGGGGYGDPALRDPQNVARDVQLGFVSRERAASDYKVVIGPGGEVDFPKTEQLRSREAAE